MYIESIDIIRFGGLSEVKFELSDEASVIEGDNESGKSTVSAFIKYMLYGFTDKTEKTLRPSWDGAAAEGSMVIRCADGRYRIGRRYRDGRDDCQITELVGNTLCHKGRQPGEVFLGVSAEVFAHTAYVNQLEGGKVNGEELSDAIGNMLFSADETLNVQRAQKRLEDERVRLWHKNRKGGKIFELENERGVLLERRKNASADLAAIISKEGQLSDLKTKIKENAGKLERMSKISVAYDAKQRARRKAAVEELRLRSVKLAVERKSIIAQYTSDGFLPDEKFIGEFDELRRKLEYIDTRLGELDDEMSASAPSKTAPEPPEAVKLLRKHGGRDALYDEYEYPRLRRRALIIFGAIFGILFIPAAVIAVSIMLINLTYGIIASLGALALMFGLVMCFISSVKYSRTVDAILDEFGAAGNSDFLKMLDEAAAYTDPPLENENHMLLEGERFRLNFQREGKLASLDELLGRWGNRSFESAVNDLANYSARIKQNTAESEKTAAELTGAEAQRATLGDEDEAGSAELAAKLPDDINIAAIRREHDFLTKANASMSAKTHELEVELAQLYTKNDSPSQLSDRITQLELELGRLRRRYDAVELAIGTLTSASETMRDSISPRLSEYAGRMMDSFSGGKYNSVAVATDLSLSYDAGVGAVTRHGVEFMSAGTQDIAYLSLRLALINLLFRRETPPLIFDESFTRLDDGRLRNVLRLLSQAANSGTQVMVFTAQSREYNMMSRSVRHVRL